MISIGHIKTLCFLGVIVLGCTSADPAHAAVVKKVEISQSGDEGMSCRAIVAEVDSMDDLILNTRAMQKESQQASIGVGVVKTVGSYLIGTLSGTIGFMAVGHLAKEVAENRGDDAAEVEGTAMQRRSLMEGMYKVKACEGDLPAPLPPPESLWPSRPEDSAAAAAYIEPATGRESAAGRSALPHETRRYND